ncbi:MAG TPA: S9 family peptidase, partial [Candidatus Dormibacteraeota bacterium]|nr:S9 family peptidase [Candidatus Dormibacteraeota bacterium]
MKLLGRLLVLVLLAALPALAQDGFIAPPESLVLDGVPQIPTSLAETAGRYASFRSASLLDWHPTKREMLISTRFAETPQLHLVAIPGGARQQLTFFADSVSNGRFHPTTGDYIVFMKDIGGGEWYQLYRYDMKTGESLLLTDGKSRNLMGPWSSEGDRIAYMSTRRTGKDTDLYLMNPSDPKTDRLLTQLSGGGWRSADWSPDDKKILLLEELSNNESYLWLVDTATGQKTELTPHNAVEKVSYGDARFSKDGKGIYVTTDKDSEFHRLAYIDLETKQPTYLTSSIHWDVETFDLAHDGKLLAFVTDEEGLNVLHVRDTSNGREMPLPHIPSGVINGLRWHKNGHELGLSLNNSRGPGECYSLDVVAE